MLNKLFFFVFVASSLFSSCNNRDRNHLEVNIEIESKELKEAILEYDSIIRSDPKFEVSTSDKNYMLTIYEENVNDSVKRFAISFSFDTWFMQVSPIWLARVGSKYVVLYPSGFYRGILATDRQFHKKIAGKYFPQEYTLLEQGKPIDTFSLIDCPSLVLTFCRDKVISKKCLWGFNGSYMNMAFI